MFSRARPRLTSLAVRQRSLRQASRRLSSQSASANGVGNQGHSSFGPLSGLIQELDKISPRFEVGPGQVEILKDPAEFYDTLKKKLLAAKRRIFLSTLYIGKSEYELVSLPLADIDICVLTYREIETLRQALATNADLKVSILTDALRGTRESPNQSCASLLVPLISEFGDERVEICMFHTPNLTGVRKAMIPKRINEGWGLQHMKLYGTDDEIIISGANLSEDYFTNRQDRYHVFKDSQITDYFDKLHSLICSLSFQIKPSKEPQGYSMEWSQSDECPSPTENPKAYREKSTTILASYIKPIVQTTRSDNQATTIVYPLVQFTPLLKPDTSTELPALQTVLNALNSKSLHMSSWTFTAGYFNMTPTVRRLLLATNPTQGTVIAASPWANGFFGSPGISGMLPDAYTLLSQRFVDAVRRQGLDSQITLKEWRRGTVGEPQGWTYHAKGLWVTLPSEDKPSLTIVGSSNYTKRSYSLDLEANVMLLTRDPSLQQQLANEQTWLQEYAKPMTSADYQNPDRHVGIKVRLAMWAVKVLGGAL